MMRLVLMCVVVLAAAAQGTAIQERRVIRVVAERFAFTPSRIEIGVSEDVDLVITSNDTMHGLRIPGTSIDVSIPKRGAGEVRVPLKLDSPGRYGFECSHLCGAGHHFMRGELVVRAATAAGR